MLLRSPTATYIQRLQRPQCLHYQLQLRRFHASTRRNAEVANHYETLGLPQTASAAEIKRQFYTLSKKHHPDHNPNDPTASTRFVQISEAYHVLGVPEKRAQYDASLRHERHPHSFHHGSYSSHAGSRPASGLSRRRTQFRGPPPSFYRSGGYGTHGAKRREHAPGSGFAGGGAHEGSSGGPAGQTSQASAEGAAAGGSGGYGPGQDTRGYDNDIPYWDREAHTRRHEGVESRLNRMRRARAKAGADEPGVGTSMLLNFVVLTSAVGLVVSLPGLFERRGKPQRKEREG